MRSGANVFTDQTLRLASLAQGDRPPPIFLYRPPRNLKKVLALVLVVAMMASFAVGASAAFKDADKITYNTAVEVLSGLGVINGYADGTFRATDSVTRGAFAKMTAYVMNGGTNAATSYGTYAAASFKDVAANSTFGNAIGYCTNKGIISGYSDGTFRAGNKVTGVQGAKMLLGALGYDSSVEGYTGSKWAMNVLADAEDAGLFKGMASVDLTQPLTREAAAQMIWNALQATMVKYSSTGVSITTPDGTVVNTGASAAQPVVNAETAAKQFVKNGYLEMIEKYFPNVTVSTDAADKSDAFGRPTVTYKNGAKTIAKLAATPTLTYTTAVTTGKVYADLGLTSGTTGTTVAKENVKTNGANAAADVVIARNGGPLTGTGNGILTEVYTDEQGTPCAIVMVKPTYGAVAISTGKETNGSVFTAYTIGGTPYKVYTNALNNETNTAVVNGTFKSNDKVLYYVVGGTAYITAPTTITAKMTAASTSNGVTTYTIGGQAYNLSAVTNAATSLTGFNADAIFVLDTYGYVVDKTGINATAEYAFVAASAEAYTLNGTTLAKSIVADVIAVDGTVSKATVSKTWDTVSGKYVDAVLANVEANKLYTVEKDANGNYMLKAVSGASATGVELTKGNPAVSTVKANNATKFYTLNFDKDGKFVGTVNTAVGFANITSATGTNVAWVDADNNGIAEVVYIYNAGTATGTTTSYVYYTGAYSTDGTTITYQMIVDGATVTMTNKEVTSGLSDAGLYTIATGSATPVTFGTTANTFDTCVLKNDGGLLYKGATASSLTYYKTVADSTPLYTITAATGSVVTGTAADLATAVTGKLAFQLNGAGEITAIIVIA